MGQIRYYLESATTNLDNNETLKNRMLHLVDSLYSNIIKREELRIEQAEFCWNLHVDILVMEDLDL